MKNQFLIIVIFLFFLLSKVNLYSNPNVNLSKDFNLPLAWGKKDVKFLPRQCWNELECDKLVNNLKRTETKIGFSCFKELAYPTSNLLKIKKRQAIIKQIFNDDDKFLKKIKELLKNFAEKEKELLALWNQHDELSSQVQKFYFPFFKSFFNNKSLFLHISSIYGLAKSFSGLFGIFFKSSLYEESFEINKLCAQDFEQWLNNDQSFLGYLKIIIKNFFLLYSKSTYKSAKIPFHWHNPNPHVFKDRFSPKIRRDINWTLGDKYIWYNEWFKGFIPSQKQDSRKNFSSQLSLLAWVSSLSDCFISDLRWIWKTVKYYKNLKEKIKVLNMLRSRMKAIAELFEIYKKLEEYTQDLPYFKELHQSEIISSPSIENLVIRIARLPKKNLIFSLGELLSLYNNVCRLKTGFLPLIKHVAYIDAYSSVVQLINENKSAEQTYSFAEFENSLSYPFIALEQFWCPLITKTNPITNDFELGKYGIRNAIFTGPNGTGKSTIMRSMAILFVLAHSWGIAPAKKTRLTPFAGIWTYLHIKENIEEGKSTFMAEKERFDFIENFVKNLSDNNFGFLLIDEPYKGTVEIESSKRVWDFGIEISKYSYIMSVMATHLERPIYLAEQNNAFVNYHLEIDGYETNNFERTFRIKSGPALWWFKDPEKRSAFVDWLFQTPL